MNELNKKLIILFYCAVSFFIIPFYVVFKKITAKNKTVVIGTRNGDSGYDNGEIFFEYLSEHSHDSVYFVCRTPNPDVSTCNVLKKNTILSNLVILNADTIYVTHSESDLIDFWWRLLWFKNVIFIQHGVIGIKKLPEYEKKKFSAVVSSSLFETNIFKKYYNISDEKIIKTGLPRFDKYTVLDNPSPKTHRILIMFTWRKFSTKDHSNILRMIIEKIQSFFGDEFDIFVVGHVHSPAINYIDNISNIEILKPKDISRAIEMSDILITDYSSIAWDFLYQNKLICFIQEDITDYKNEEGLYYQQDDFFGHFEHSIESIDNDFISRIKKSNYINNRNFLKKYPFYINKNKKHAEMLYEQTRG